jgi:hypothetical protein
MDKIPDTPEGSRIKAAMSEDQNVFVLEALAKDDHFPVIEALCSNPSCPPSALAYLADRYQEQVREKIAANPNSPTEVLSEIHKLWTSQENTPPTLAQYSAAKPDLDPSLIRRLTLLAANPNFDPSLIHRYVKGALTPAPIILALIGNIAARPYLADLAKSSDPAVRALIARRTDTPAQVIKDLLDDPDPMIRFLAAKMVAHWHEKRAIEMLGMKYPMEFLTAKIKHQSDPSHRSRRRPSKTPVEFLEI